tara:strand:+ start:1234 stop:1431 length:198 start_codon:yes stop_codon:yes gene_type:complete
MVKKFNSNFNNSLFNVGRYKHKAIRNKNRSEMMRGIKVLSKFEGFDEEMFIKGWSSSERVKGYKI